MNVLVIGCGTIGSQLAKMLSSKEHNVSVLDLNEDNFFRLGDNFEGSTVSGAPMDMNVLRDSGIEYCDAVAVVTSDDNLNITICQIVNKFFNVNNIIARISDPSKELFFKKFGIKTICPTNFACNEMYNLMVKDDTNE